MGQLLSHRLGPRALKAAVPELYIVADLRHFPMRKETELNRSCLGLPERHLGPKYQGFVPDILAPRRRNTSAHRLFRLLRLAAYRRSQPLRAGKSRRSFHKKHTYITCEVKAACELSGERTSVSSHPWPSNKINIPIE
jgi:hypothetical protein